ncbi:hypothetical protein C8R46DRAFT_1075463 [Mycena filopes]|nr:hypothetical protein C8R46DRAFT_1075463 [Mycena filopes]
MSFAPPPSLSHITHPVSPLQQDHPPDSPLPESPRGHDIAQIRARALELALATEGSDPTSTPRERELLDMVLRLTNPEQPLLDPTQLLRQADTIAGLIQQREYLARRVEEEKSRWESEKEGWDRMSEALLIHRHRKVGGPDDSELKKISTSLEYENLALKDQLNQTQGRINALESEIFKLKPHLLMQPFVPRPVVVSPANPSPVTAPVNTSVSADSDTQIILENTPNVPSEGTPTSVPTVQPPSLHSLAQASSYFTALPFPSIGNVDTTVAHKRKLTAQLKRSLLPKTTPAPRDDNLAQAFPAPPPTARTVLNSPTKKPGRAGKSTRRLAPPQLLASDARAEHLLIAARRLGRERAGIVAGVISAERERMEHEKADRDKDRLEREKERIEREKKNRGGGGYYRERPEQGTSGPKAGGTPTPGRQESSKARYATAMAGYVTAAGTPAKSEIMTPAKADTKGKGKSVPTPSPLSTTTPLDSLLSAARSMQEIPNGANAEGANASAASTSASTGMVTRRRAANSSEQPDSASPPKRRKLSTETRSTPARTRTALEVLADQAAASVGSDAPPDKGKGRGRGKGKAKAAAVSTADEEVIAATTAVPAVRRRPGRPSTKERNKGAGGTAANALPSIAPTGGEAANNGAGSASTSAAAGETPTATRPVTRWVQRGKLATGARAPPRQKDDVESEEEEEDPVESSKAGKRRRVETPAPEPVAAPVVVPAPEEPRPQHEMQDVQPAIVATPPPAESEPKLKPESARQSNEAASSSSPLIPESVNATAAVVSSQPVLEMVSVIVETAPPAPAEIPPAADETPMLSATDKDPPPAVDEVLPTTDEIDIPPVDEVPPATTAALDAFANIRATTVPEDAVLDADADGESDPDVDMDANTHI